MSIEFWSRQTTLDTSAISINLNPDIDRRTAESRTAYVNLSPCHEEKNIPW